MELITPKKAVLQSYLNAIEEYKQNNIHTYSFLNPDNYDIFEYMENSRTGKDLPEGYVKGTYLWLVDKDEFIGEVCIRHDLTDSLLRFGGNIGYGVRYSKWNQGYGTLMLSKALEYARESIGLTRVLLTCNDDNYGSSIVIERSGGVLQDKIVNTINGIDRITRRYWIEL